MEKPTGTNRRKHRRQIDRPHRYRVLLPEVDLRIPERGKAIHRTAQGVSVAPAAEVKARLGVPYSYRNAQMRASFGASRDDAPKICTALRLADRGALTSGVSLIWDEDGKPIIYQNTSHPPTGLLLQVRPQSRLRPHTKHFAPDPCRCGTRPQQPGAIRHYANLAQLPAFAERGPMTRQNVTCFSRSTNAATSGQMRLVCGCFNSGPER
ncbi:hypothetical protein BJY52DRAFT_1224090 [Lactarius psammicola]|nr:hypothetical protein BJY52DRAFT_1224090 [Lactarius psammicola]